MRTEIWRGCRNVEDGWRCVTEAGEELFIQYPADYAERFKTGPARVPEIERADTRVTSNVTVSGPRSSSSGAKGRQRVVRSAAARKQRVAARARREQQKRRAAKARHLFPSADDGTELAAAEKALLRPRS
jgi:hypothetical protein